MTRFPLGKDAGHESLHHGYMGKWQFAPILGVTVAIATVTVFVTARVMDIGVGSVLLETGWVFVLAVLAALAVYRIMLSRYDHRIQYAGLQGINPIHLWFMHREARVDHIAIPLTVGALLYTVVFGTFIISRLIDAVVHKLVTVLTFH